jgi:protein-disulfide isomerase
MAFMGPIPAALLVSPAAAGIVSVEEAMSEMVLGKPDAPVTMIEYSSLGCPHCADFHRDTLPRIKTEYVDTGKVRLIYRDFPLGTPALAASMIARCAGPEKYFGFIDIIYRSQAQWSRSNNPLDALSQVARFGGMSKADVGACLKTQTLLDHIRRVATLAQETQKVVSTPTFIIGDQTITGAQPFENFKKAIDKALNK